jgi:hypothetical protein
MLDDDESESEPEDEESDDEDDDEDDSEGDLLFFDGTASSFSAGLDDDTGADEAVACLEALTSSPQFAIVAGSYGLSLASVGSASTLRKTSAPATTRPKTTCFPSDQLHSKVKDVFINICGFVSDVT